MYVCAAGVFHGPLSAGRAVAVPLGHSGAAGTRSAGAQVYHTYVHTYIHTYIHTIPLKSKTSICCISVMQVCIEGEH